MWLESLAIERRGGREHRFIADERTDPKQSWSSCRSSRDSALMSYEVGIPNPDATIDPRLVKLSLEDVEGFKFEDFGKEFFAAIQGPEFVPLGGVHDDGADGASSGLYSAAHGHYWQFSKRADTKAKVKETIDRLRATGLTPTVLWYVTSRDVAHSQVMEDHFLHDVGVAVRIRDREYLSHQVNYSPATRSAWQRHLASEVAYLGQVGSARTIGVTSAHTEHPDVFVFLQQELDRRDGQTGLTHAVVDSLILWALEGTDPNAGRFMSEVEIEARILEAIPSVEPLIRRPLSRRLSALAEKAGGSRSIKYHRKEDGYCLPYEARDALAAENLEDEELRVATTEALVARATEALHDDEDRADEAAIIAGCVLDAIRGALAERGLDFANWVGADEPPQGADHYSSVNERLNEALLASALPEERRSAAFEAGAAVLRGAFYSSTPAEREYFGKLARTYVLLFTLQQNPRVIQFFQEMAGDFRLYVGTDQIIRAISERYLPVEDRMTRLMLEMARAAGATLLLTEPVVNEVTNHIRLSDNEYRNYIAPMEGAGMLDQALATQVPKILVRAYLYARLTGGPGAPSSWEAYLMQVADPDDIRAGRGEDAITSYLRNQFGFEYVPENDLVGMTDETQVAQLAAQFVEKVNKSETLAKHDALMATAIYADRRRQHEHPGNSPFGFSTWWLTDEAAILRATGNLVKANGGHRYLMRPDFVLNFLALAPTAHDVRQTYRSVFPTLLGIRLSRRMGPTAFHEAMKPLDDWNNLEDGRRVALVEELTNKLKADMMRRYVITGEPKFQIDGDPF